MADITFYQHFFAELETRNIDVANYTFNGLTSDKFTEYKRQINGCFTGFENELDNALLISTVDNLNLLNILKSRIIRVKEAFEKTYNTFTDKHKFMVINNPQSGAKRKLPKKAFKNNPALQQLDKVIAFQLNLIRKTEKCIQEKLDIVAPESKPAEVKELPAVKEKTNRAIPIETTAIEVVSSIPTSSNQNSKKVLLKLSKKEIALSFILLCGVDIINPDEMKGLYNIIQNNFLYIDNSKGKHKVSEIKDINSTFCRLSDGTKEPPNKKFSKKFIEKYRRKVDAYFDSLLKVNLEDFRVKY
jgi:hypothetical protein